MLQLVIIGGKVLTALVWVAGIWAWATGSDAFFAQMMRLVLPLTVGGHVFLAMLFYLWGRKLQLATVSNLLQILLFGMFHVADVWLKRVKETSK